MKVEYKLQLGERDVVVSQDCETDSDMFKFLSHMHELFDNSICTRQGKKSNKVRINVRSDGDDNEYFEMLCVDPSVPECNYAKRKFGVNKKGGTLFPKNKDDDGNWRPWVQYNKVTGKEE